MDGFKMALVVDKYYIQHDCKKFTYEYTHIYLDKDGWNLEMDSQSSCIIFYCPFCGERLE